MKSVQGLLVTLMRVSCPVAFVLATVQCTTIIDSGRQQCQSKNDCLTIKSAPSDAECQNNVCVASASWSCLTTPITTSAVGAGPYTVRVPLIDVSTLEPVAGVTAFVYKKTDQGLEHPSGPFVSGDDGYLTLRVEPLGASGFEGFMSLTQPDSVTAPPAYYFFNPAIGGDTEVAPVRVASLAAVTSLVTNVGENVDTSRGFIVTSAEDCLGNAAAGISYSSTVADSGTLAFYSEGHLPTTKASATDDSGYGGLIGVVPGNVTLVGSHVVHGKIGEVTVFVKAGAVSYTRMVPNAKR
jgi:hypothetical protein